MSAADYLDAPGRPGVRVALVGRRKNHKGEQVFGFAYAGTAEALIAARVATERMLKRTGTKVRRADEDGDGYRIDQWQGSRDGQPYPRFRVIRWKPAEAAMRLPGAREAMAARGVKMLTSPRSMQSTAIRTPADTSVAPTARIVDFDSWRRCGK